jgi:hypothetical protein
MCEKSIKDPSAICFLPPIKMKKKKDIGNLIHQYLRGTLAGKELESFEKHIRNDDVLRKEVEYHLALKEATGYLSVQNFREAIKTIANNYRNELTGKIKKSTQKPGKENQSETLTDS